MNPETEAPIEPTEKKARKPRTPKAIEIKGYTKVAESKEIVSAARKWTEEQSIVENNSLYVKNEFINWQAYRDQDVLIPASEGVTRSADANGAIDPNVPVVPAAV